MILTTKVPTLNIKARHQASYTNVAIQGHSQRKLTDKKLQLAALTSELITTMKDVQH